MRICALVGIGLIAFFGGSNLAADGCFVLAAIEGCLWLAKWS